MNADALDRILHQMKGAFADGVRRHESAFSTGLRLRSGRGLGIYVEELLAHWRVSDGGDAWTDLVLEGYCNREPTASDAEKLTRACSMHGVTWDPEARSVGAVVQNLEDVARVAPRIAAAALAIDGWAAWYPVAERKTESTETIMRSVARLAPGAGWEMNDEGRLPGRIHSWPVNTVLERRSVRAAVQISREKSAEHVIQRAVGFLLDVRDAGLVLALPPSIAKHVEDAREFQSRVRVVPLVKGAAKLIVAAAESAAA